IWWCPACRERTGFSTRLRSPAWLWTWFPSARPSESPTDHKPNCRSALEYIQ
ncbi:hypothetical protein M9458_054616, partial [Cirrhinus mrigala]